MLGPSMPDVTSRGEDYLGWFVGIKVSTWNLNEYQTIFTDMCLHVYSGQITYLPLKFSNCIFSNITLTLSLVKA